MTMLLDQFDRILEAPGAVTRLRRFVLDLAVRGRLVRQDRNDEPASGLLERARLDMNRWSRSGTVRRPVATTEPVEERFQLPHSWVWCRVSMIGAVVGGGTPPGDDADNFCPGGTGVAWLTPADLGRQKGLHVSHGARDLTPKGLSSSSAALIPKGSVLFTSRAPIGYTAIAANELATNQGFKSVVPYVSDCSPFVAVYFRAFASWIDGKAPGTTFREVSGKIVSNLPFPLPPLAEQQRIVAKVDELTRLCDQLDGQLDAVQLHRTRLMEATLDQALQGS